VIALSSAVPAAANFHRRPAMHSINVFEQGSGYGWIFRGPANELLGRGTAQTEKKTRTDAFSAAMTYIDRRKNWLSPKDPSGLH
jgi:hypothetical protein